MTDLVTKALAMFTDPVKAMAFARATEKQAHRTGDEKLLRQAIEMIDRLS